MRRSPRNLVAFLLIIGVIFVLRSFQQSPFLRQDHRPRQTSSQQGAPQAAHQAAGKENSPFGNPSPGNTSEDFLLENPYFTSSYNNSKGGPNWVAWRLVADDIGDAPQLPFFQDKTLPWAFKKIFPDDYTGSGFDRGHQCNHEDRSSSDEASNATFAMSNMLPQAPDLNRKTWATLEEYCRKLAKRGSTLYILCGGSGSGGEGDKGPATTLRKKVNVPATCWKVILITDGSQTPNENWKIIAVNMPNQQDIDLNWKTFLTTTKSLETLTGLQFFPNISDDPIIAQIKATKWR